MIGSLNKSKLFFGWTLSFVAGIFARSFWDMNLILAWFLLVIAVVILLLNYRNRQIVFATGILLFFVAGVWRAEFSLQKIVSVPEINKEISVSATVAKEPIAKEYNQNIVVAINKKELLKYFSEKEEIQKVQKQDWHFFKNKKIKILFKTDLYQKLQYGDKLILQCSPKIPQNFSKEFNYRMYLAKEGIYYICPQADFEKIGESKLNIYGVILKTKKEMEKNIAMVIAQPEAILADGLLFGGSGKLPKNLKNDFSKTGMTHIVAVSGYNVTIIAEYLMLAGIFLGFWRKQAFYFALLGIFLFVAMIGFPGSAVRAGVMGMLVLWAVKNGRIASADNALLLAGGVMLLINPLLLRWDIGFQLSFLATLGIIKTSPIWQDNFVSKIKSFGFLEIIFMTISAQIFVLPIIVYNFHTLSLISILANVFVLTIIPLTMLFVFLTALLGTIVYPLSLVFGWLAYWLLKYEISIIEWLANFRWASWKFQTINIFWLIMWYIFVFIVLFFVLKWKKKTRRQIF